MGLEQVLVQIPKVGPIKAYQTIDRYTINEIVLYTPPPKPFELAKDFGIGGGGIARPINDLPLIERYRFDTSHDKPHINYETILETLGKSRPLLDKHNKIVDFRDLHF